MTEHQDPDKNMIRCQAKIRNPQSQLGNNKQLSDGVFKKIIRVKQFEHPEVSNTSVDLNSLKPPPNVSYQQFSGDLGSSKINYEDLESTKPQSKLNFEDSWMKIDNEELVSIICRQQYTKRSESTDFPDFQRNMIPLINSECDISFDESHILQNYHFEASSIKNNRQYSKNSGHQKVLQQKNTEIINILVSKNQEKKILEKKIFDLEFELFVQKRNSDNNLNGVILELRNAEGACECLQIEVKRLKEELELAQEQKVKSQVSYQASISVLQKTIMSLEVKCNQLVAQVEQSHQSLETIKNQNKLLSKRINQQISESALNSEKIQLLKQQFSENFELNLEFDEIQNIQQNPSQILDHNIQGAQSQQSVQSQYSEFQALIKQLQKEVAEKKKKIKQQKKLILHLEGKVRYLEGAAVSLEIVNDLLACANNQTMAYQLRQLSLKFQYEEL